MENKQLVIEVAGAEDGEWIAKAQVAMAMDSENMTLDPDTVRAGVRKFFDEPARGFYLIARAVGEADPLPGTNVGCLLCQKEWSDWRNGDVWWLHSLYVVPECRRQGIFMKMYEVLKKKAQAAGVRGIRLYVDRTNTGAQKAYENIGMTDEHYLLYEEMF